MKVYLVMDADNEYSGYCYRSWDLAQKHAGLIWMGQVLEVEPIDVIPEWVINMGEARDE